MSAKNYGVYQVDTFAGSVGWYFEVAIKAAGVLHILINSSRHEDYVGYVSQKAAEHAGIDWLHSHLDELVQEVEEALDTL